MSHRLLSHTEVSTALTCEARPGGCWELKVRSQNKPGGHRQKRINGRLVYVHRLAYEMANGPVPAGLLVCHTCDHPWCCNPAHLYAGTVADNARDAAALGHLSRGYGDDHASCKYPDAVVRRVRQLRSEGRSLAYIEAVTGMGSSYASRVSRGIARGHS